MHTHVEIGPAGLNAEDSPTIEPSSTTKSNPLQKKRRQARMKATTGEKLKRVLNVKRWSQQRNEFYWPSLRARNLFCLLNEQNKILKRLECKRHEESPHLSHQLCMRKRKLFIIRRSVALQEWKGKDYADIKRGAVGRLFRVGDALVRNAEKTHIFKQFLT